MASHNEYHLAAEHDVSGKMNRHIWWIFIGLGGSLFLTLVGLTIMYRFQVDYEREKKIGLVSTQESKAQMSLSQSYITGKRGIFSDKRYVPVEEAATKFLQDFRRAR